MSESFNLGNLMDDLSTYAETATDEELLEDARQGGQDTDAAPDDLRAILRRAIDEWKLEQLFLK